MIPSPCVKLRWPTGELGCYIFLAQLSLVAQTNFDVLHLRRFFTRLLANVREHWGGIRDLFRALDLLPSLLGSQVTPP